jgi:predicted Zn finger-like uncharacterized protein
MIVTCQNCNARFNLKDSLVKPKGSKVRCSKCRTIFVVYPETPPEAPVSAQPTDGVGGTPPAGSAKDQGLDLSEIEKMLDSSPGEVQAGDSKEEKRPPSKPDETSSGPDTSMGVLDISEIEKMLETDPGAGAEVEEEGPEPEDLIFDLDEEVEAKEAGGDFDLSDIEKMLEQDMKETEAEAPAASDDSDDIDLSDLDDLMKSSPGTEPAASELEAPATPETTASSPAATEDLDLSGLEEMMETESSEDSGSPAASQEEELKLELEGAEAEQGSETEATPSDTTEELDFSGLEEMMEKEDGGESADSAQAEASSPAPAPEEASEELSLEFEAEEPDASAGEGEDEDDFKISLDAEEDDGASEAVEEVSASEDLDLQFLDEPTDQSAAEGETTTEAAAAMDSGGAAPGVDITEDLEPEEEGEVVSSGGPEPEILKAGEERSSTVWVVALILILAIGGLGGGFLYMYQGSFHNSFWSGAQKSQGPDPGYSKIKAMDIDARFVDNKDAGRLFVISGKARNEYPDARSFIQITGKLYAQGKRLVSTQAVYCGNMLSPLEISKLPLKTIRSRLENKEGDNKADVGIKPGQERPFMIVFSNLPENLEEYTVEATGSQTAGATGAHP